MLPLTDVRTVAAALASVERRMQDLAPLSPEAEDAIEAARRLERAAAVSALFPARSPSWQSDHLQIAFRKAVEAGVPLW